MKEKHILFDGRLLLHEPLGPAAGHLFEILSSLPDDIQAHLAVPEEPPVWLDGRIGIHRLPHPDPQAGRLRWEQRQVPALAQQLGVDSLHLVGDYAPLFSRVPVWVSPAGYEHPEPAGGLRERLRRSTALGGLVRASGLFWPEALPASGQVGQVLKLPRRVHPEFIPKGFFFPPEIPGIDDLPGNYYLFHGPTDDMTLRQALEAWTWAAGPVGDVHPLLMLGIPQEKKPIVERLVRRHHLGDTVVILPSISLEHLPTLYRAATAVFHPSEASPWGGPMVWGIACGLPVVGHERPLASAIAGNAAYLVDPQDTRGLGAALISVVVKDTLRRQLREAAIERAYSWRAQTIGEVLAENYRRF